jgi:alkylhydroperoxidase family enzyme
VSTTARSWLGSAVDASTPGLLALRPDLGELLDAMLDQLWRTLDPVLLELCRLHVSTIIGDRVGAVHRTPGVDLDPALLDSLGSWWSSPRYDDRLRACLAYAEQFVVDVHGITDQHAATVAAHLSPPEQVAFTTALGLFDGLARMRAALAEPALEPEPASASGSASDSGSTANEPEVAR